MISRRNFLRALVVGTAIYPFKNVLASQKPGRILKQMFS